VSSPPDELIEHLRNAGFLTPERDARALRDVAAGDLRLLDTLVARRLEGEPLEWITGEAVFCGIEVRVDSGVYVPRRQTEALARRAAARLPSTGLAIDVCTGCGAIAAYLSATHPRARVCATDVDPHAIACARTNRVDAHLGDLLEPVPLDRWRDTDVIVAVVPYVPTGALPLLQRDTFTFETTLSYDGGTDGTLLLRRLIATSPRLLKPGGALLFELGGDQATLVDDDLRRFGFSDVSVLTDEDGDVRGIEATFGGCA
jgi:release factor glutamine methyltransferase